MSEEQVDAPAAAEPEVQIEPAAVELIDKVADGEVTVDPFGRPVDLNYGHRPDGLPVSTQGSDVEPDESTQVEVVAEVTTPEATAPEGEFQLSDGTKVSAKDLMDSYEKIHDRYGVLGRAEQKVKQTETALAQERHNFQGQMNVATEFMNNVAAAANSGDPSALIDVIAGASNVDSKTLSDNMYTSMMRAAERRAEMSEEELGFEEQKAGQDRERKVFEQEKAAFAKAQQDEERQRQVGNVNQQRRQLVEQSGFTTDRLNQSGAELEKLAASGKLDPAYATVIRNADAVGKLQEVINYTKARDIWTRVDKAIDSVDPKLRNDKALVEEVMSYVDGSRSYRTKDSTLSEMVHSYSEGLTGKPASPAKAAPAAVAPRTTQAPATGGDEEVVPISLADLMR